MFFEMYVFFIYLFFFFTDVHHYIFVYVRLFLNLIHECNVIMIVCLSLHFSNWKQQSRIQRQKLACLHRVLSKIDYIKCINLLIVELSDEKQLWTIIISIVLLLKRIMNIFWNEYIFMIKIWKKIKMKSLMKKYKYIFFIEIANIIESLFPLRLKIFILYFFFS